MHCVKDAVEETKTLIRHSASAAIGCSGTVRMAERLNTMKDPVPWLIIMFPIITIILIFFHILRLDVYQDVGFFHFMAIWIDVAMAFFPRAPAKGSS
jgi:hypothetical protein